MNKGTVLLKSAILVLIFLSGFSCRNAEQQTLPSPYVAQLVNFKGRVWNGDSPASGAIVIVTDTTLRIPLFMFSHADGSFSYPVGAPQEVVVFAFHESVPTLVAFKKLSLSTGENGRIDLRIDIPFDSPTLAMDLGGSMQGGFPSVAMRLVTSIEQRSGADAKAVGQSLRTIFEQWEDHPESDSGNPAFSHSASELRKRREEVPLPEMEHRGVPSQEELADIIIEGEIDASTLSRRNTICSGLPSTDTFIPFEVPPQPLEGFSPQPSYPQQAKSLGIKGKVTAQVFVNETGEVKCWRIVQARPEGSGFEKEVEKVLPKWKFTPAIQQGRPVGVWIAIPFQFKMN